MVICKIRDYSESLAQDGPECSSRGSGMGEITDKWRYLA